MQLDKLQREIKVGSPVVFHDGSKSANLKIGTVARMTEKNVIIEEQWSSGYVYKIQRKFDQVIVIE